MFTLPTNNPMMKALFNTNMVKVVYSEDFQNKRRVYLPNTPSPYHNPIYSIWAVGVCAVRKFGFFINRVCVPNSSKGPGDKNENNKK
jgi:hypothetical protein